MGVQFMQSEGLFSQLLQVGNLLHIGQREARHNWRQYGEAISGGGYFKALLDEEEASISSQYAVHAELDTKPFGIRTSAAANVVHAANLAGNINKVPINANISASAIQVTNPPASAVKSIPSQACLEPCLEPKPSTIISSPLKRARENEGIIASGGGKREKKGSEESVKDKGRNKGGVAAEAAVAGGGRKGGSVKTKVPKPAPVEPPARTDYVDVRARRGQATDSHSLAERVRREKISERMRFLQDLVPGCSKITGKALILDEIINYVQSLQNQVEFLAMRLAATTPKPEFASLSNSTDEEIASPFVEEVRDRIDVLPKAITTHAPTSALQFDSLTAFYPSLFDESDFNSSIVSDLSTSTCNESDLTNMDFSHLG